MISVQKETFVLASIRVLGKSIGIYYVVILRTNVASIIYGMALRNRS